jgi:hypothetical protein
VLLAGPSGLFIDKPIYVWILRSRAMWRSYLRLSTTLAKTVSKKALEK